MRNSCIVSCVKTDFCPCRTFPWVLAVYDLQPYHFYKVIELAIRAEDGFSRDVIKHLNAVSIYYPACTEKQLSEVLQKFTDEVRFILGIEPGSIGPSFLGLVSYPLTSHPFTVVKAVEFFLHSRC